MHKESTIRFPAAAMGGTKIVTALILFFGLQFAARADVAYMSTDNGPGFGTIDLTTGIYTSIGTTQDELAGLGEINNILYGLDYAGFGTPGTLYTIDTTNGSLTAVGLPGINSAYEFEAFGSTLTGLYAIGAFNNTPTLFSIDPTTGVATPITIGTAGTGLNLGGDYSLSTNSSTLYFADDSPPGDTPSLYTLNTTTGAATLVGTTTSDGGPTTEEFGALLLDGTTLYGGQDFDGTSVDTLNPASGAVTVGPSLSGTTGGEAFGGLAPIPATTVVPEPSSFSLLLLVVLSAGILIIKARRQTAADPD
jgi:hypothetical protein